MIPVEKLPEVTEKMLHGLKADASLRHRIYTAALQPSPGSTSLVRSRWITVSCCLALATAAAVWGIHAGMNGQNKPLSSFRVFSSASHTETSPVFLQNFLNP